MASVSTSEPDPLSTSRYVSLVESLPHCNDSITSTSRIQPFRTVIQPSNNSSFLVGFGKIKAPRSFNTSVVSTMAFSKEHSFHGCTPPHENTNEFGSGYPKRRTQHQTVKDNEASDVGLSSSAFSYSEAATASSFVETVNLVSITGMDTVFNKMERAQTTIIDHVRVTKVPTFDLEFGHRQGNVVGFPQSDKYNPHIDWGPRFKVLSTSILVIQN